MKIAICNCERVIGRCSSMGCFRCFNDKSKHFSRYEGKEVILSAYNYCNGCSSGSFDDLEKIASRMADGGISIVHLGPCALKCPTGKLDTIKEVFLSKGMDLVEGTH